MTPGRVEWSIVLTGDLTTNAMSFTHATNNKHVRHTLHSHELRNIVALAADSGTYHDRLFLLFTTTNHELYQRRRHQNVLCSEYIYIHNFSNEYLSHTQVTITISCATYVVTFTQLVHLYKSP